MAAALMSTSVAADDSAMKAKLMELQEQVNELAAQVDETKTASSANGVKIGGYGELHYNNLRTTETGQPSSDKKELDFHRFVLFFGHDFSEDVRFFSEFELEHSLAGDGKPGEVELEQAYVEIDLNENLYTRSGVQLVPVGILNETHEPETFYGVERNNVEKNIIPTTWWSGGVSLHGKNSDGLSYDLMVSEGLYSSDGHSIRGGRQKTAEAKANNLAYTGRLKYTGTPGLELAATIRHETDIGQDQLADKAAATLLETHAVYESGPFGLRALYAQWDIGGDAAKAADAEKQQGYYIEPSYKINSNWGVFARHSEWNKTTLSKNKEKQTDFGVNFWPHKNVVFKADVQSYSKDDKKTKGFNLGVGYSF